MSNSKLKLQKRTLLLEELQSLEAKLNIATELVIPTQEKKNVEETNQVSPDLDMIDLASILLKDITKVVGSVTSLMSLTKSSGFASAVAGINDVYRSLGELGKYKTVVSSIGEDASIDTKIILTGGLVLSIVGSSFIFSS